MYHVNFSGQKDDAICLAEALQPPHGGQDPFENEESQHSDQSYDPTCRRTSEGYVPPFSTSYHRTRPCGQVQCFICLIFAAFFAGVQLLLKQI